MSLDLECLKEVSRVCQECFHGVSRKIEGFQGCLKEVQWVFEGSFKGVSRKFQGYLKEGLRVF